MPPFREKPVRVDPLIDGEMLHELRDIGHGHWVHIVDASYDIPRDAKVVNYSGTSANALLGIARLIPIDTDERYHHIMTRGENAGEEDPDEKKVSAQALKAFEEIVDQLLTDEEGQIFLDPYYSYPEDFHAEVDDEPKSLFVRTIDDLPFACMSLRVGHSQLTDSE
jgi:L-fucose mutarotase/ribose pyranase (RbsD/FucU family)